MYMFSSCSITNIRNNIAAVTVTKENIEMVLLAMCESRGFWCSSSNSKYRSLDETVDVHKFVYAIHRLRHGYVDRCLVSFYAYGCTLFTMFCSSLVFFPIFNGYNRIINSHQWQNNASRFSINVRSFNEYHLFSPDWL